jgi:hypothetical protein
MSKLSECQADPLIQNAGAFDGGMAAVRAVLMTVVGMAF